MAPSLPVSAADCNAACCALLPSLLAEGAGAAGKPWAVSGFSVSAVLGLEAAKALAHDSNCASSMLAGAEAVSIPGQIRCPVAAFLRMTRMRSGGS